MKNKIVIKNIINPFNKTIEIEGDKSLSIRWALLASQAIGKSKSFNLLKSEDVLSTLSCLKKLGVKIKNLESGCEITGVGLNGFNYKKNLTLDAGNSGTLARLIMGLLVHSKSKIKLTGDKSLSKRDFIRITNPLKKFGTKFKTNSGKLPIIIEGARSPKTIKYNETIGSAQVKSAVMLAALNTPGVTKIKAAKSRDHSERMFKNLKLPIKVKSKKNFDLIEVMGLKQFNAFDYIVPGDISSSAFFIVLTILSNNSRIRIKNININKSRIGIITILKKMNCKISLKNKKIYKGEKIADIIIKSTQNIKSINCPSKFNSAAIDEFLLLFLVAAKAKGISHFKDLAELNQKESPRLMWGSKILTKMGVKNIVTKNDIKIYGNPNLKVKKRVVIKNFLKDHRVFMASSIAALTFGAEWIIHEKMSINTSFPSFLKKIRYLGGIIR